MDENTFEPVEALVLLNPHALDYRHIPGSWAGLKPDDIAARLSKVGRPQSALARYKYAGQQEYRQQLLHSLIVHIAGTIITAKHNQKLPILWPFAELCIRECCDTRACTWCKGNGHLPETDTDGKLTGGILACEACGSDGQYKWTDSKRLSVLNISKDQWKQTYSGLYTQCLTVIWGWDRDVRDCMADIVR